jgi:hypothetical protein
MIAHQPSPAASSDSRLPQSSTSTLSADGAQIRNSLIFNLPLLNIIDLTF